MRPSSAQRTYFFVGAALCLLIVLHYAGWLRPLETMAQTLLVAPFTKLRSISVNIGNKYEFFSNRDEFIKNYEQCAVQVQDQSVWKAKAALLERENTELKKHLGYIRGAGRAVAASVMGNTLDSSGERALILDQGSTAEIEVGQPVVVGAGALIGKVAKVSPTTAMVRLLNDNRSRVAATILNNERSLGIVEGGYSISLRMKFIPRQEVVQVGDQVATSGLEPRVPRGLLIGTVAVVENQAYQSFQQVILTPAVDASKVTIVSVLLQP